MLILNKNKHLTQKDDMRLASGLSLIEFQCRCKRCDAVLVSNRLLSAYAKFRNAVNVPLKINCGYRCPSHNREVEGSSTLSRHQSGEAIDISLSTLRGLFSNDETKRMANEAGFTFVKFYKTFVHMDVR